MATITLQRRRGGWADIYRRYKVLIDGEQIGAIRRGERQTFEVAPGTHQVMLKIDWGRSNPVDVHVEEGETAELFCQPNPGPFTTLYFITFGYRRYIKLGAQP